MGHYMKYALNMHWFKKYDYIGILEITSTILPLFTAQIIILLVFQKLPHNSSNKFALLKLKFALVTSGVAKSLCQQHYLIEVVHFESNELFHVFISNLSAQFDWMTYRHYFYRSIAFDRHLSIAFDRYLLLKTIVIGSKAKYTEN